MVHLESSWLEHLGVEFAKEYMINLKSFLQSELESSKVIYPHGQDIFNAFNSTPFNKVKVCLIGQDPYHGPGQAHGLCFSVRKGVATPPSLKNIFKELTSDVNFKVPDHGNLQSWCEQGVLLLNAVLTVQAHQPASHQNKGWELFTDAAVKALNDHKDHVIFVLWGSFAQKKALNIIDQQKHTILTAPHPSPLSASRGFLGCRHFSKINKILESKGQKTIDWAL